MVGTDQIQVVLLEKLDKGKRRITFDNRERCILYFSEFRGLHVEEGSYISYEVYEKIISEIIGKRAKKRALHLLEQMDRTEQQLREKLMLSEYPQRCIEDAIAYVKRFHYLDDGRYAHTFTRYKKDKMSRQQILQKLMSKGIARDVIAIAIEEEYDADESVQIRSILEKKHFSNDMADEGEFRRTYNYLLRRGFCSNDILKEMKRTGTDW
ncbi:MAG: regulatory protein RecX [Agathobacter sp.]|nr:regulatory protein RecX [Agathobacter sp.]